MVSLTSDSRKPQSICESIIRNRVSMFMRCQPLQVALIVIWAALTPGVLQAQLSGSRGGTSSSTGEVDSNSLSHLNNDAVERYITIDGSVELRVKPTQMRIVLAITTEGDTPVACHQAAKARISALQDDWNSAGFGKDRVVEDFIAILPVYDFQVEQQEGQPVAVERKVGYLMQSNLHVSVASNDEAYQALSIAFAHDVSDVIAVDYWSDEIDQVKAEASAKALEVAKQKSDRFLGALFDEKPRVINFQEQTKVYYPASLYESFDNSYDAEFRTSYNQRNMAIKRVFRPKNTYYRGLKFNGDVQAAELPMNPELSVVATVRLYFESPIAKYERETERQKDDDRDEEDD